MNQLVLLLMVLINPQNTDAAAFEVTQYYNQRYHITLWGRIDEGDNDVFRGVVLEELRKGRLITALRIYTPGGSVPAAISIAEQVRLLGASTMSPYKQSDGKPRCMTGGFDRTLWDTSDKCLCASACFIVWSGGETRQGDYVGIHRPYYKQAYFGGLTPDKAKELYDAMDADVRAHFKRMEMPDWIINLMFSISSGDMHYMTADQLLQTRRSQAWLDELLLAKCGKVPDGIYFQSAERKKVVDCNDVIWTQTYSQNMQKFLDKYGRPGEKFTLAKVTAPTIVAPPPPSRYVAPNIPVEPKRANPLPPPVKIPDIGLADQYSARDNRDPDGRDIVPMIRGLDFAGCAMACRNQPGCTGFGYDKWNKACFLKDTIIALRLDPKSMSGYDKNVMSMPPTAPGMAKMENYRGRYFQGTGYSTTTQFNQDACMQTCQGDLSCVGWTYAKTGNTCSLFKSIADSFKDVNYDSGIKTQVN